MKRRARCRRCRAATPQARLERGRARAVGKRRQAGQAAAQTARASKPSPTRWQDRRDRSAAEAARTGPAPPRIADAAKTGSRRRWRRSAAASARNCRAARKDIDARLDLHGMTQTRAHRALFGFLQRAHQRRPDLRARHHRQGPASGPESERGVLRRQVPQWLGLPEFRSLVVGFEEAHIGHGGEGALYVRVRRARSSILRTVDDRSASA